MFARARVGHRYAYAEHCVCMSFMGIRGASSIDSDREGRRLYVFLLCFHIHFSATFLRFLSLHGHASLHYNHERTWVTTMVQHHSNACHWWSVPLLAQLHSVSDWLNEESMYACNTMRVAPAAIAHCANKYHSHCESTPLQATSL